MPWSTRELAELAATTVNTVRHYHRLGLLDEPERTGNGYKQYGVRHLVRLLRIRRLAELGVPLARMGEVGAGADATPDVLRELDTGLAQRIEDLQRARDDIAAILRDGAPADVTQGFAPLAARLSEADRSMIHIYAQLYDADAMADVRRMVEADTGDVGAEVDALPPDADEATRRRLAERLAPSIAQSLVDYPWLNDPAAHLSRSEKVTQQTFTEALVELYNPAQVDVLARAAVLAHEQVHAAREPSSVDTSASD